MSAAASAERTAQLRRALLDHYDRHARPLPWRGESDPYRVLVSEIMLQQTRADTVASYYGRWLRRFPDLDRLADAPLDDVLKAWEGLGYYRRARNLHAAASLIRERHGGRVPAQPEALRALPGVGEYTAGAVASIAFGAPTPAVDGNARRVLARLFDLARPAAAELRQLAARLVDPHRPGDFNQALMDLGATVCTPVSPRCGVCPVARACLARERRTQRERPLPVRKPEPPVADFAVVVRLHDDATVLLRRRPEDGLLGGLWEFPAVRIRSPRAAASAARRLAGSLTAGTLSRGRRLAAVPHAFTHLRAIYHPVLFRVAARAGAGTPEGVRADADTVDRLALPVAQRRIWALAHSSSLGPAPGGGRRAARP
jgi:A/G-specific adenine glycosylase